MPHIKKQSATLHDLLHVSVKYLKYWKLAVLFLAFGLASSAAYLTYGKPGFYSRSIVSYSDLYSPIHSESSEVVGRGRWAHLQFLLQSALNSRWLVEQTASELGLVTQPGQYEYVREKFVSKVRASPMPGNLFQIEVYGYQPWIVREWPEAMITSYQRYMLSQRAKHRENALNAYTGEMESLRDKIYADRTSLVKFEEDNKIIEQYISNNSVGNVPGEMLSIKNKMDSMDEVISMLDEQKLSTVEKLSLIKKVKGKPVPVGSLMRNSLPENIVTTAPSAVQNMSANSFSQAPPGNVTNGSLATTTASQIVVVPSMVEELEPWEKTERALRAAFQEREQLSANYLPGHELMRTVNNRISQLELSLEDEYRVVKSSFMLEREHMNLKFEELQKKMPDYRRVLNDFDRYKQDYYLLSSGRVAWESAYSNLKKKVTEMEYTGSELESDLSFQGFTMLRDEDPVSPNKKTLLLYGLILGLALAGGVSYGFEKFKSSTSLVSDTEEITGLHALGVLPLSTSTDDFRRLFITGQTASNTGYDMRESFRIVRTSIPLHVSRDNKCQVILVTSSRPGEGKTVASSILARSFAEAGEKTILIDADLRRGRIEHLLDVADYKGLRSYLVKECASIEDCRSHIPGSNLDVVVRGGYSSNAVEELGRSRFAELVNNLRTQYARIVIDTPPVLGLADALTVAPIVDGVLFVIRSEKTTRRDIIGGIEQIAMTGVPIYGFLLNGVDLNKMENYYYYSSYYPKYYDPGYDYSEG